MATAKKPAGASSSPPWVAIVGAIVAVGGTAYTWFSHFNPKVEPSKSTPVAVTTPPVAAVTPQVSASVSSIGQGSVAIGSVGGNNTVNLAAPAVSPEPAASTAAKTK